MRLNPWLRCTCGKIHLRVGIGPLTKCTCDRSLWSQLFGEVS